MTPRPWWRYTYCAIVSYCTDLYFAFKQVYLPAIQGYVPDTMVKALQAFLDFCYIVQCDVHDTRSLEALEDALDQFHQHCEIFKTSGVCLNGFNLPHSHAAVHYLCLVRAFGAPNGLCSSITESKHIKVVKEPWHWSSRWEVLKQMLTTNSHLDKLSAVWVDFASCGMLKGSVLKGVLSQLGASCTVSHLLSNPDILNLTLRYPRWWSTSCTSSSTSSGWKWTWRWQWWGWWQPCCWVTCQSIENFM